MIIICEFFVHIFNPQKKERDWIKRGVRWKVVIEINVVKLKYPLKHYCKQSAIDIKKSALSKVSTFVKVKWIGKKGICIFLPLLICVSWKIKKFHLLEFSFYPPFSSFTSIFYYIWRWKIFSSWIDFHHYWCTSEYPLHMG